MRKLLLSLTTFIILFVTLTGLLTLLADAHPLQPGDPFYGLQRLGEAWQLRLTWGATRRADLALDITEHRLADLLAAAEGEQAHPAALLFGEALDDALRLITEAPEDDHTRLDGRLAAILFRANEGLAAMPGQAGDDALLTLAARITDLLAAYVAGDEITAEPEPAETPVSEIEPAAVSFLGQMDHDQFFPLDGAHAALECTGCHTDGRYQDTPNTCTDCHQPPDDHFVGQCSECHLTADWVPFQFDHRQITDCISCHQPHSPPEHYPGDCATCHLSTTDWVEVSFDHVGFTDCQSCHRQHEPPDHFAGRCSNCHISTGDWLLITFDHTGFTNCQSCHTGDAPANHYPGQCSNCHTSTTSWGQVVFNHSGFTDCVGCHSSNAPPAHYPGQCSSCHNTSNWGDATFNHSGFNDCQSCHTPPAGHFPGQCSACHNTEDWDDAEFTHAGLTDCQSCHQPPGSHFPGQCANCHNTEDWDDGEFSHAGLTDCQSCHSPPGDEDHPPPVPQCANCHNTEDWD